MAQSSRFWDRIAARYARRPVADEAIYQKKLQVTRRYFRPDTEVMEFGCGTGSTAIAHAPYVKHILAIDFSSKMIEIAKARAEAQDIDNIDFVQSSIEEIDPADRSPDVVLGLNILHLLDDREAVIAAIHRMLEPGGVFVSSTVCVGDMMKLLRYILPIGRLLGLIPLVTVFSSRELVQNLTAAGFEIEYEWQPGSGNTVFIIAKKAGRT